MASRKKIAFISEHASPLALLGGTDSGGQNIYVDQLARQLTRLGYEVDVFTRWDDEDQAQVVPYAKGVRLVHMAAGPKAFVPKEELFQYMDEFAAQMIRFIKEQEINYQVIHAHFWMSGYVAATLKKRLHIPYMITFHALGKVRRIYQGAADRFPSSRFTVEEAVARTADMIIAECPQDREDLKLHYKAQDSRMHIVPCGFDKEEFQPISKQKARAHLGLDQSEFVILQLGRVVPRKGIDNVIRGMASMLQQKNVPVRLVIVGGESEDPDPEKTPEIKRLQEIAEAEHVADKVTFIGRRGRSHLKYFYSAADVFVSTPWYEPFGITPLEAMACGTPVIGSNVGGIKFSVQDGKTGFLVPPNDPDALADKLLMVYENPQIANAFSRNGIKRVNTLFTWEIVAREIAGLYETQILSAQKGKSSLLNKIQLPLIEQLYGPKGGDTTVPTLAQQTLT
ncbi:glycosyltransferase involved in cell wall biosynthesis [Pontibacter ummariensis]|uniref:Glycosyltransferase involved in cell wall bisynthesis n=1 Tax=Pontibacter ummariensis TaxID=1610492 RepID=A0A239FFI1_9BACT|nr:glycosyltransferase family 1 protein [Pontibacter ummariensis]PRY12281.1 glycosyltransferase involved in cell wall biosynthesis [Pontibacter ummariensis]SNS55557.1 Glycosyltransferase involved in cell wall bisynthesis [Pontibacter ummariensis]